MKKEQNSQLWLLPNKKECELTVLPNKSKEYSFIECFDGKFSYEIWLLCKTDRKTRLGLCVNGKWIYEKMVVEPTNKPEWRLFGNFQVVKGEHSLIIKNNDEIPFTAEGIIVTRDSGYITRGPAEEHRKKIIEGREPEELFEESGMTFSEEEPDDVRKSRLNMLYKQGFIERFDQNASENRCRCGVPLGGVGTGKVELDKDGVFTAITINNNFDVPFYKTEGSFFAVRCDKNAVMLQKKNYNSYNFPTVENIDFNGLFPTAELKYNDGRIPAKLSLNAYSFLPHDDVKNSVIPAAVFDFTAENPTDKPIDMSIMFSWENILGMGGSMALKSEDDEPSSFVMNTWNAGTTWSNRTGTYQKKVSENALEYGIKTKSKNIQNIGEYAIYCTDKKCRAKKSWRINDGEKLWNEFLSGEFTDSEETGNEENYDYVAGALCSDFILKPNEKKTVTFVLAWHMPHFLDINKNDIGIYYDNFYKNALETAKYAAENKDILYAKTREIYNEIEKSTLPSWLKSKLINDMFPIVTCSWFDKKGHFSINESPTGMMGCLGTMDQRLACNVIYTNFFHDLDRSEMTLFAKNQGENGSISHDVGFGSFREEPFGGTWSDLCSSFIIQIYKDYIYNADEKYLDEMYPRCKKAVDYQLSTDRDDDGIPDVGSGLGTTYDTYHWYGACPFVASLWLAELRCCEKLAEIKGDKAFADDCRKYFDRASKSMVDKLLCKDYPFGDYFISYNDVPNAKKSENCFISQLAGAWASKLLGLGDILDRDIIKTVLKTVYNRNVTLNNMKIMNDETTPEGDFALYGYTFVQYDEVYFGCAALYYDMFSEGLDAFKRVYDATTESPWNIVLTHFYDGSRVGLPYYMTNPASFFILEALSGFVPNVAAKTLTLAPHTNGKDMILPLFSPVMWLTLDYKNCENESVYVVDTVSTKKSVSFDKFVTESDKKVSRIEINGKDVIFIQNGRDIEAYCKITVESGNRNIIKVIF